MSKVENLQDDFHRGYRCGFRFGLCVTLVNLGVSVVLLMMFNQTIKELRQELQSIEAQAQG